MKKIFFTCCWVMLLGWLNTTATFATNLITSPTMDDVGGWSTLLIASTSEDNAPVVTWGYTADKPAEGTGAALRIQKSVDAPQAQFTLYQKVSLTGGVTYELDGAFKISDGLNYWVEAYIGKTAPVATEDYTTNQGPQIAGFNFWGPPSKADGTFKANVGGAKNFTPTESGDYYIVFKIGCNDNGRYNLLLDDLFFGIPEKPEASFKVNARAGFAPLVVTFTNTSVRATSYEWNFGDGSTSTDQSPVHTYTNPGDYKVTLNAISSAGNSIVEKDKFIQAKEFTGQITGGGKLLGGNMEDATKWNIITLNSPVDQKPVATWNYTENVPKAGSNGALRVQASGTNATVQYCIYQKVTLDASRAYRFNAAFRDLSVNLWHFWTEVFISEYEPADGSDFGPGSGVTQLCELGNWEDAAGLTRGLDGSYKAHTTVNEFIPGTSGDYYFVFKTGIYVPENQTIDFDVVIDELLLEEIRTKPYTNFTATNSQGFSPLEVTFTNTTLFANSYLWDFGDGRTSTEQNPVHTYTEVGKYNVTLKATNEMGDSTLVKNAFVSVNDRPQLPDGEKLYGGSMDNGGYWYTARIGGASPVNLTWDYTENVPTGGEGGALRLQAAPPSGKGSNIALYQPVTFKNGFVYTFDGLFKVIGNTNQMWLQVYVAKDKPNDTSDPLDEKNTWGQLNTWADGTVTGYDGPISGKAIAGTNHTNGALTYIHTGETGEYYFIVKVGTWDHAMDIVLDNLSLKEALNVKADFSADASESPTAPFTVQFFDMSTNATSWLWNFGDGSTSTEQDPEHTYMQNGNYTVTLTVYNGSASNTKTIQNMIKVGNAAINDAEVIDYTIRTENGRIKVVSGKEITSVTLYDVKGMLIESVKLNAATYTSGRLSNGIYILNIDGKVSKVLIK